MREAELTFRIIDAILLCEGCSGDAAHHVKGTDVTVSIKNKRAAIVAPHSLSHYAIHTPLYDSAEYDGLRISYFAVLVDKKASPVLVLWTLIDSKFEQAVDAAFFPKNAEELFDDLCHVISILATARPHIRELTLEIKKGMTNVQPYNGLENSYMAAVVLSFMFVLFQVGKLTDVQNEKANCETRLTVFRNELDEKEAEIAKIKEEAQNERERLEAALRESRSSHDTISFDRDQAQQELQRLTEERDKVLEEKQKMEQERDRALEEKQKMEQERNRVLEEKQRVEEENDRAHHELQRVKTEIQTAEEIVQNARLEREQAAQQAARAIEERDQAIEEKQQAEQALKDSGIEAAQNKIKDLQLKVDSFQLKSRTTTGVVLNSALPLPETVAQTWRGLIIDQSPVMEEIVEYQMEIPTFLRFIYSVERVAHDIIHDKELSCMQALGYPEVDDNNPQIRTVRRQLQDNYEVWKETLMEHPLAALENFHLENISDDLKDCIGDFVELFAACALNDPVIRMEKIDENHIELDESYDLSQVQSDQWLDASPRRGQARPRINMAVPALKRGKDLDTAVDLVKTYLLAIVE